MGFNAAGLANELKMFTENDGDIYRQQTTAILKNLATKKARGVYDSELAVQAFMHLAETGAKKYAHEFGEPELHGTRCSPCPCVGKRQWDGSMSSRPSLTLATMTFCCL